MNYKVGQRVRIVLKLSIYFGCEATITALKANRTLYSGRCGLAHLVDVDGVGGVGKRGLRLAYLAEDLAPLTDPKADAFLEGIRKLKPYEEPKVVAINRIGMPPVVIRK